MIPKILSNEDLETVYDRLAASIDEVPEQARLVLLAKVALALANYVGDLKKIELAISAAMRDLQQST
jgi:hypothetical protein